MGTEEEFNDYMSSKYIKEMERRDQAVRMQRLNLDHLACQLFYWNQYKLTPQELRYEPNDKNDNRRKKTA